MPQSVVQHLVYARRCSRLITSFSLVGLLLPLGGCLVGLEKPDAALDVPNAYSTRVRSPDAKLPTPDWWRGFKSKQLTDLIEESLTSNLDIAAAIARIVQADAQARIVGAALLPTVGANASYTRSRASQSTGTIQQTTTGVSERNSYSASLSASYEIDFWGKNRATLLAAQSTAAA